MEGTTQRHDNTLIVTARIGGFEVKIVLVDQGSGAEVIIVINTIPFRLEWPEYLVPVSKPKQRPPVFHLGWNFGPFRAISEFRSVLVNTGRD